MSEHTPGPYQQRLDWHRHRPFSHEEYDAAVAEVVKELESTNARLRELLTQHKEYDLGDSVYVSFHEPTDKWYPYHKGISLEYKLGDEQIGFSTVFDAIEYVDKMRDKINNELAEGGR